MGHDVADRSKIRQVTASSHDTWPMVQKDLAPWDHKQGPTRQWLLRSAGWTDPFVEKSWLA